MEDSGKRVVRESTRVRKAPERYNPVTGSSYAVQRLLQEAEKVQTRLDKEIQEIRRLHMQSHRLHMQKSKVEEPKIKAKVTPSVPDSVSKTRMKKKTYKEALMTRSKLNPGGKRAQRRLKGNDESAKAHKLWEECHNLVTEEYQEVHEYSEETGKVIARTIDNIRANILERGASHAQQYMLKKGLAIFGAEGEAAAKGELLQQHQRVCFTPIDPSKLTKQERKRAMISLMLLTKKASGEIKGRQVYNGKPSRDWVSKEEKASPTVANEALTLTCMVDAHEGRDVMGADVPNAFIQTSLPKRKGEERVVMKITGKLVDWLVELAPETYRGYVVTERGKKVLYVVVLRAIYGMLEAAMLWYKELRRKLESIGFEMNPYDPCVANRTVNKKQHTVRFHVDDILSSHMDKKVNDQFHLWLKETFGKLKDVKVSRGKVHEFLGQLIDFSKPGTVIFSQDDHVEDMIASCPVKLSKGAAAPTPAGNNLFNVGKSKPLSKEMREQFHTCVAKGLFIAKRSRPDILLTVSVLCGRVRGPNSKDLEKLVRLCKYMNATKELHLILTANDMRVMKIYVDASYGVHEDLRSHTGAMTKFGQGSAYSASLKQKVNARSSTEAELIGVDDVMAQVVWTINFLGARGVEISKNILYQDNKSAMLLERNGFESVGKRSKHLNIRYFFVKDIERAGMVCIEHCPTAEMIADFFTKPLQGQKFKEFRSQVLGM